MDKLGCGGCTSETEVTQRKQLEEMMKKRVKSKECPLKGTCTQKVLKEEAELMCKDQEMSQEAAMIHVNGKHVWMLCKEYNDVLRNKEGRLPKNW